MLAGIALLTGLEIHREWPLHELRTLALHRVSLRQALDRLLDQRNFVLRSRRGSPAELWIYAGDAGNGAAAAPAPSSADCAAGAAIAATALDECPGSADADPTLADDPARRLEAVEELADLAAGDAETLARLAEIAISDPARAVREEAIYGLSQLGDLSLPFLEQALADPDAKVRSAAVEAVVDVGGEASAWALGDLLDSADRPLREQAVYALAEIGGEVAFVLLERALVDPQPEVRDVAAELLGELLVDTPER